MSPELPVQRQRVDRLVNTLVVALIVLVALLIVLLMWLGRGVGEQPKLIDAPTTGLRSLKILYGPGVGKNPFFNGPMAAAFGTGGRIYVADTGNNRVVVFSPDGKYLFEFGGLGVGKPAPGGTASWKPGLLNYPTDIAIDENGEVYVADFRNDQIQVFAADGRFLRAFPDRTKSVGKGASGQDGTGIAVTSLAVRAGRVYATDTYQVLVFDTLGQLVSQFGRPGRGKGGLNHPNGIAVSSDSVLAVSDSNNNRVVGLTLGGAPLWTTADPKDVKEATAGLLPSRFEVPRGLDYMDNGKIMVTDALASRLVRLSSTGVWDGTFGQRGDGPGELNFPTDVDFDGGRFVVAEKGGDRVQVVTIDEPK